MKKCYEGKGGYGFLYLLCIHTRRITTFFPRFTCSRLSSRFWISSSPALENKSWTSSVNHKSIQSATRFAVRILLLARKPRQQQLFCALLWSWVFYTFVLFISEFQHCWVIVYLQYFLITRADPAVKNAVLTIHQHHVPKPHKLISVHWSALTIIYYQYQYL